MTHGVEVAITANSDPALSSLSRRTEDLHNSIARRAFDLFASSGFSNGHDLPDWFSAESEFLQPVSVEMSENEKELTSSADLPGFTEKDIEVVCPYHASRFALEDGRVLNGPAVHPQPCLEVRTRQDQIEVRTARTRS